VLETGFKLAARYGVSRAPKVRDLLHLLLDGRSNFGHDIYVTLQ
jgi:hypothetical protein